MPRRSKALDDLMRSKGWVSPAEAATRTGIGRSTIYDAIETGALTSQKERGFTFVSVESLIGWGGVTAQEMWTASEPAEPEREKPARRSRARRGGKTRPPPGRTPEDPGS